MGNRRAFWAALTLVIAMSASCTAILGIDKDWHKADVDPGIACLNDAQCDDMNACTDDACPVEIKHCLNIARPDMTDAPAQTPGDCHKTVCAGGKEEVVIDTTDPKDDINDCTVDSCDAVGNTAHTAKPDKTPCKLAGQDGECDPFATCKIDCGPGKPMCDDLNSCTSDSCNAGTSKCDFIPLADGMQTPGFTQVPNDCHIHLCIGGFDTDTADDTDLPANNNDCTTPTCTNGAPTTPSKSTGTGCAMNGGKVCDGAGACVACNGDGDCPGPTDECKHPQCTNHTCGTYFTPSGTAVAQQTQGDCKKNVCDGAGNITIVVDDTDIGFDGNGCTKDICTNGVLSHPPQPANTACGAGMTLVCDGAGNCIGCVDNTKCIAPETCGGCGAPMVCCCQPKTCAQLNPVATCGSWPNGCGGMVTCNSGTKNGNETDVDCGGGGACNQTCGQGKKCGVNSDCASGFCVEGVCCNSACNGTCQSCLAANKVSGSDGACGTIKNGIDPKNNCTDQGQVSCGTDGQCDGAGACRYYATGSICAAASCANATTLNKADTCTAGHTCMDNGQQSCGNYICDTSPNPDACKTTCSSNLDCANNTYCAAPNCLAKKPNGLMCGGNGECMSGNCIDGYCCDLSCTGTCQACNVGGSVGTCTNLPQYINDSNPVCGGAADTSHTCDGFGTCLLANGEICSSNPQCASNNCTGGPKTCQP